MAMWHFFRPQNASSDVDAVPNERQPLVDSGRSLSVPPSRCLYDSRRSALYRLRTARAFPAPVLLFPLNATYSGLFCGDVSSVS